MTDESELPRHEGSALKRWLPLILLGLFGIGLVASGLHKQLSLENIANNKALLQAYVSGNKATALIIFMATYIMVAALSIPGALLMTLMGGILFPFWLAIFAVVISATIGATLLFVVAQSSFGHAIRARGGKTIERMADGLRRDAASYLLFLRLVPVFPFAAVNLAAAIIGVPLKTYLWTTAIGILPASLAYVFAATRFGLLLEERKAGFESCKQSGKADCAFSFDFTTLVSPNLLLAFAALGFIALIPVIVRRFFNKPTPVNE
jgi:uncharacterized membrane protein YdjX (TVP38/TMEM64 family)